ncbi:response regulator [Deltaproteobacteria bacterium TL4]
MPVDLNMHVLVVDDFAQMRRIMIKLLRDIGFTRFTEAEDGVAAITKLKLHQDDNKFGLVLLDWNMPKMHGIEVVTIMKHSPKLKDIPVLMVTAEAKEENVRAAMKAGVDKFMLKPFNAKQLSEKINQLFEEHAAAAAECVAAEQKAKQENSVKTNPKQVENNAKTLTALSEKKLGKI